MNAEQDYQRAKAAHQEAVECVGAAEKRLATSRKWEGEARAQLEQARVARTQAPPEADIPRRIRLDRNTAAELAIRSAVDAVERAGAHPLLTEAVNLLHAAREKVADWVDATTQD